MKPLIRRQKMFFFYGIFVWILWTNYFTLYETRTDAFQMNKKKKHNLNNVPICMYYVCVEQSYMIWDHITFKTESKIEHKRVSYVCFYNSNII